MRRFSSYGSSYIVFSFCPCSMRPGQEPHATVILFQPHAESAGKANVACLSSLSLCSGLETLYYPIPYKNLPAPGRREGGSGRAGSAAKHAP